MNAFRAVKQALLAIHTIGGPGQEPGRFNQPTAIAFDDDGRLLVGDAWNSRLSLFAPGGALLFAWSVQDFTPSAVTVATDGIIWACDLHAGRVIRFSPRGDTIDIVGDLDPLLAPSGIAALPDGRVAVADTGNHCIRVFSPDGRQDLVIGAIGALDLREPHGMATDRHGTLIAVDRQRGRLVRFGAEWDYPEEIDLHLARGTSAHPWDVAIDRKGRMAVTMTGSDQVLLLSPSGDLLSSMSGEENAVGRLLYPTAIAFGPGDLLAIADTYNDRVVLAKSG